MNEVLESIGKELPFSVLLFLTAALAFWHQTRQHRAHTASLERRFDEQTRATDRAYNFAVTELKEMVRTLQLERDALRRERNSLRRELNKPVDES